MKFPEPAFPIFKWHPINRGLRRKKRHVCPVCGKNCGNKGLLEMHMRSPGKGSRAAHNIAQGLLPSGNIRRAKGVRKLSVEESANSIIKDLSTRIDKEK